MRINEIFYSIQGEGRWTGTPAVFVRFSGCNLCCPFCDTDFNAFTEMTEEEVMEEVCKYPAHHVVLTGGEPCLQLTGSFLRMLHERGRYIQIETNGTIELAPGMRKKINWVTCSPKWEYNEGAEVRLSCIDELKVLMTADNDPTVFNETAKSCLVAYIQPCDTGEPEENGKIIRRAVNFIKENPIWRLSLQTQKILNVR